MNAIKRYFAEMANDWKNAVTMREAVQASAFETELRLLTNSEELREEIRRAAILCAKLGLLEAEIEPMARAWFMREHTVSLSDLGVPIAYQARISEAIRPITESAH